MQPDNFYYSIETGWSADLFRRANAGEGIFAWRGYGRPLRQLGGGFQEGKPRERTQQHAKKSSLGLGSEELGRACCSQIHAHVYTYTYTRAPPRKQMDENGDGVLDRAEIDHCLRNLGFPFEEVSDCLFFRFPTTNTPATGILFEGICGPFVQCIIRSNIYTTQHLPRH